MKPPLILIKNLRSGKKQIASKQKVIIIFWGGGEMGDNYSLSFFERERKKEQDRKLCGVASKVNSTEIV